MDEIVSQVLRLSLPLVLAALSETVSERGGVVNLGIEGMMLAGALVAYLVAAGQPAAALPVAWLAAAAVGALLGSLSALAILGMRADAIVAGTALHFLCLGATGLLFEKFKRARGVTLFSEHGSLWQWLPYLATALLIAATAGFLYRTAAGLRLRAAGESPAALRAAGGSPARSRLLALVIAGSLSAVAGASLTTVITGEFVEGMSHGRGFLALSLVILARWNPFGALIAGLFMGACISIELRLSSMMATGEDSAMRDLLVFSARSLPYLLAIAALALVGPRKLSAPAALGTSLERP